MDEFFPCLLLLMFIAVVVPVTVLLVRLSFLRLKYFASACRHRMQLYFQDRERRRRLNQLARYLQIALLRIDRAEDFRRAAIHAAKAHAVPLPFRQKLFRKFRPQLVAHYHNRLVAGSDSQELSKSLIALLRYLGIAPFEAEYIRLEAERTSSIPLPPETDTRPGYDQQVLALQREHQQRMGSLENMHTLDPELQEQLRQAERQRFQDAVLAITNPGNRHEQVPRIPINPHQV